MRISKLNFKIFLIFILLLSNSLIYYSCKDYNTELEEEVEASSTTYASDTTEVTDATDETLKEDDYEIPTYADDYSDYGDDIAAWSARDSWNLANVHDPTVAYYDGYYYMYQTDASYGNVSEGYGHFFYRRSTDLVNWTFMGSSMDEDDPEWVTDTLNSIRSYYGLDPITDPTLGYWAPCVRNYNGTYRMYYSIVVDNYIGSGDENTTQNFDKTWTERAFIGLKETTDLSSNEWTDKGMVVCSVSDKGDDWSRSSTSDYDAYFKYNAIDPSYIITPEGEHWLIYGSWHSGIAALQLDPDTGLPLNDFDYTDENTWGTCIYSKDYDSRWQGSEGPEVVYYSETGYYYLFMAYDALTIPYNTRVCRATSVTGPYYDYFGNNITEDGGDIYPIITHPYAFDDHSGWVGISHCGVFQNEDSGDWFYTSQARLPENTGGNAYSNAIMMGQVRKMRWTEDGWPVVMPERYTAYPETEIEEDELAGVWENITLEYSYADQDESESLTLNADNTATGALGSSWSFDATDNVLTIGTTKLYVEREVDWEADPRVITLIYSGLNSEGESLWGKRVSDNGSTSIRD